jgi:hypothetical protein
MVSCPKGHQNPDDNEFCSECGAPLPTSAAAPTATPAAAPDPPRATPDHVSAPVPVTRQSLTLSRTQLIAAGLVGAVLIVGILGLLATRGSGSSSAKQAAVVTRVVTVLVPQPTQAAPTQAAPSVVAVASQAPTASPTATSSPSPSPSPSPSASPSPTSSPTATPTSLADAPAGTILYQANWSSGLAGWAGMDGWKVLNGQLLNDGTGNEQFEAAPVNLSGVADYAVEADIAIVQAPGSYDFGLFSRDGSYFATINHDNPYISPSADLGDKDRGLASKGFDPARDKHIYRLEVKGNTMQFLIDGTVVDQAIDNKYLDSGKKGQVGLRCQQAQLVVTGFRVIKL